MLLLELPNPTLSHWENFYVIVGSSAGALTGLQFVVMTLLKEQHSSSMDQVRAFGSPTVVHFCFALLISALMSMPSPTLRGTSVCIIISGVLGLVYAINVVSHAHRQEGYHPDREDWLWYIITPILAYTALTVSGLLLPKLTEALYVPAATALGLLFLGIRNSWDTVTYIAVAQHEQRRLRRERRESAEAVPPAQ
ncbi:MAG TPA: hypothetical protein VGC88_07455 [Terriglobales bacterium]|jgi:hypothetical protein